MNLNLHHWHVTHITHELLHFKSRCPCSVDDLPKDMSQIKCVYKCNVQDAGPQTSPWLHYHQRSMGYIQSYQSFIYIFFILFWSCAPQSSLGEISCMEIKSDFWPFTSPCLTGCCGQVFTLCTRSLYLLFIWKRSRMIYKKKIFVYEEQYQYLYFSTTWYQEHFLDRRFFVFSPVNWFLQCDTVPDFFFFIFFFQ